MKIAVIGAGAIGSVVAAYLTKIGQDVMLVGRQDQVDAIGANGLKIDGIRGEEVFQINCQTKLDLAYELVIFAVKTQDIEQAYQDNCEFLEDCWILTTQNGVQADSMLSIHFDREKMISSIVMFGATYVKPGEITLNFEGDWIVGKPYFANCPTVHQISEVFEKAFNIVVSDNIMGMKYLKLFVNFNNCIPALIGKSMQETFVDMDLCRLSVMLLKEGVGIVNKSKIALESLPKFPADRIFGLAAMSVDQGAGIMNKTLTTLSEEPLYGSILQSIMRKKVSEIDFINGEVVQLAHHLQMKAPLNLKVVDMVHQIENNGKFFSIDEVKEAFVLS